MNALASFFGCREVFGRNLVVYIPGEDVSNARLASFITVETADYAAVDHATHARHINEFVAVHHVTG